MIWWLEGPQLCWCCNSLCNELQRRLSSWTRLAQLDWHGRMLGAVEMLTAMLGRFVHFCLVSQRRKKCSCIADMHDILSHLFLGIDSISMYQWSVSMRLSILNQSKTYIHKYIRSAEICGLPAMTATRGIVALLGAFRPNLATAQAEHQPCPVVLWSYVGHSTKITNAVRTSQKIQAYTESVWIWKWMWMDSDGFSNSLVTLPVFLR